MYAYYRYVGYMHAYYWYVHVCLLLVCMPTIGIYAYYWYVCLLLVCMLTVTIQWCIIMCMYALVHKFNKR